MAPDILLKDYHHNGARIVVGLDPSRKTLTDWGLPFSPDGLEQFCTLCADALATAPAIAKIQPAFFEQFGYRGLHILETLALRLRDISVPVILDAKRGDIGSTVQAYAEAYIGNPALPVAGLTVNPYLGVGALKPFFDKAAAHQCTVFVVARSSNPEGDAIQTATTANGDSVTAHICENIAACNRALGAPVAGAVLGATQGQEFTALAQRLDGALILAPGIGAQGASLKSLHEAAGAHYGQTIPAASRAILEHGGDPQALARAINDMSAEDRALRHPQRQPST